MTERRRYLLLVAGLVVALVGVGLLAIPGSPVERKATLGLDLQGGLEVVLEAEPPKNQPNHKLTAEDIDRSITIMRNRVDKLGVSEPEIRKQGSNQIVIELAGVHDPEKAANLIGKTAQLQFYDLESDLVSPSIDANLNPHAERKLYNVLAGIQAQVKGSTEWYLFDGKTRKQLAGPAVSKKDLLANYKRKLPKNHKVFGVPSNRVVVTCVPDAKRNNPCPGVPNLAPLKYFYLFKYQPQNRANPIPEMTGEDLKLSGTRADFDQQNQPVVLMSFTGHGSDVFHNITRKEAQRGRTVGTPQHFAIVLDGNIESFPQIDYKQYPDGIAGNNGAEISNVGTLGDAKDLALVLQTGALPVQFVTKSRTEVSATLGKDSLQQAKRAAAIGLILVAIFLLLFYRFLGLVAVIGLGIYVAFLYAAILLFHVTLTLPGFAGMILTIGVAADANVVIFERIKEEVRSGKSVRNAIATGYSKGFHTIIDANVVTAITALVLFGVATAGVKGFALMLLIGTVISLITAVAATRALLGLLGGFSWFDNPRLLGATAQDIPRWQKIDINSQKRRRIWLTAATVAIALSILLLVVKGLNLGIDFKGGTQVTFTTPKPVALNTVRDETSKVANCAIGCIQGRGKALGANGEDYKNFQIRTKSLTPAEQAKLTDGLRSSLDAQVRQVTNISSSFSRQIARGAIFAIIVSFALLMVYITFRFQWRFAIPILRTLFSDILITLGIYSLSGREVTTATVAAVLTVLGYSIYDTIIVFDRIRENIPLMRRASFATIANVSLWETVRRSLATTFITLLPIASLLIFGGATLKDFAFALFVGISLGAISTFFVATPFLTVIMERHPDFKRRVGQDEIVETGVGGAAVVVRTPEPEPEPAVEVAPEVDEDLVPAAPGDAPQADARRERRRQRRRSRPHGRSR